MVQFSGSTIIRITVVKLEGNQVRIGIEAPDDLMILRAELLQNEDDETATAATSARSLLPKA
ncbi:carbon storage regulator [Singulisphaera sp. PoT]|uniref:carbon storage regulator n=1 Tax=Singulisphaera sp. PoT TaxID=3411797 RepID=UPI003BF52E6E